MKKLLFVSIAAFGFVCTSQAQEMKFGIKAGVNFTDFNIDNDFDYYEMRSSYHFGGVGELILTPKVSVQAELLYSSQGAD